MVVTSHEIQAQINKKEQNIHGIHVSCVAAYRIWCGHSGILKGTCTFCIVNIVSQFQFFFSLNRQSFHYYPLIADSDIRFCVLSSLDERFDAHLAQAENLSALFVALNDEVIINYH